MERTFKFYAVTYGCRVNQYETQAIREWWQSLGGTETDDPAEADVMLVDSCAVTAEAVSDARQMTRKLGRLNPEARIFAAGCAASAEPADFRLPGVAAVIPQRDKFVLLRGHPLEMTDFSVAEEGRPRFAPFAIRSFRRARPVVKVQDGCSQGCAYCIIPLTRGPARSRPVDDILAETRRLLENGYREIMISGVNLRQFHADGADGRNFWTLLRRMDAEFSPEWRDRARFRLSSLDPAQVTAAECLETLEGCRMVCPHLHLSLQSGSMAVLRRMGRSPYSPESVTDAVAKMRRFWPVMGLGADILMGFPGETEEETEETLAMLRALPMTYAHVFPYSVRPGTRAAELKDQLPKKVRQEHAARVRALMAEKHGKFLQAQLAMPGMTVAFDSADARHGNNEWYADCRMEDESCAARRGHELVRVSPVRVEGNLIIVRPAGGEDLTNHPPGE
ncbi:MiaB/RimO family radical SAM methylthiotransferase [uncultured Mailhella sp.]|uniref:MiaB/RimO family radical SAM methylthiotransferase n=1 Tax=uncultured Mailhella sp. TaxID=1981031 RepID=UPI0025E9030E|nr:MiaB/RimO family radical SAM methylthiotransferase [uncultured Mailhella sp.]